MNVGEYKVKKALNNNVVIAERDNQEVVVIGKGIGFARKNGDWLEQQDIEKLFVLKDEKEQQSYLKLLPHISQTMIDVTVEAIFLIGKKAGMDLNEHIHIGLLDHLSFAHARIAQGMAIENPFLAETKALYPREYAIAKEVVALVGKQTGVELPEGEIGFIALHIHSAIQNKSMNIVNSHSQLVSHLVSLVESQFAIKLDKESMDYLRLVRHLRFTIERVMTGEKVEEPKTVAKLLKQEYPVCYNLSWKLIKVMQRTLGKPVYDAEAVYLTMHLQRVQNKSK